MDASTSVWSEIYGAPDQPNCTAVFVASRTVNAF